MDSNNMQKDNLKIPLQLCLTQFSLQFYNIAWANIKEKECHQTQILFNSS